MKNRNTLFGILLLWTATTFAQDEGGMQTLFKGGKTIGGMGGVFTQVAAFNGEPGFYLGGGGGALINGKLMIGGYGMGLISSHSVNITSQTPEGAVTESFNVDMGQGGLWLNYSHRPERLVHLNYGLMLGAGGLSYYRTNDPSRSFYSSGYFAVTPSLGVEVNLFEFMKLRASGAYQLSTAFERGPLQNTDINSPMFRIGLFVGYFGN